ncbi:hypothetical protein JK156_18640 [Enterobacter ludwigii]|uniref:hypothetical protein n=1 Tax=Enterobacter ludwigii TaxID=299767 RepID=UPI001238C05A|nr:hypothetical protein [Enterobacter ludwigii]MBS0870003.1 hypothetical protein [Enterobacter ludwigii]
MNKSLDPDISSMSLSDGEKWGLQIYRNYSRSFGEHRVKSFVEQTSLFEGDIQLFEKIAMMIVSEEVRIIPVIVAAYTDDQLKDMFKREMPVGVPGGRSALMSGFGPLARLSQRIQLAFAFGWLSKDLLIEFDHIRKIRNDLSHSWDIESLEARIEELIDVRQSPIEEFLGDGVHFPENFHLSMSLLDRFRVRVIWLLGRLTYETRLWVPALKSGLVPEKALYGPYVPTMLSSIAAISVEYTHKVIQK